jgi:hypothetical protein
MKHVRNKIDRGSGVLEVIKNLQDLTRNHWQGQVDILNWYFDVSGKLIYFPVELVFSLFMLSHFAAIVKSPEFPCPNKPDSLIFSASETPCVFMPTQRSIKGPCIFNSLVVAARRQVSGDLGCKQSITS